MLTARRQRRGIFQQFFFHHSSVAGEDEKYFRFSLERFLCLLLKSSFHSFSRNTENSSCYFFLCALNFQPPNKLELSSRNSIHRHRWRRSQTIHPFFHSLSVSPRPLIPQDSCVQNFKTVAVVVVLHHEKCASESARVSQLRQRMERRKK